jgi:Bacteriophage lambda integrase, N-terminal domain.
MARPRKHNISIPNLYRKLDKRNGKIYWQYYNQLEDKFVSIGSDEGAATSAAIELNRIIASKQIDQSLAIVDAVLGKNDSTKKVCVFMIG